MRADRFTAATPHTGKKSILKKIAGSPPAIFFGVVAVVQKMGKRKEAVRLSPMVLAYI